jgi:hypothetical protein
MLIARPFAAHLHGIFLLPDFKKLTIDRLHSNFIRIKDR